jgi:NADPH:quinone reductase-like Zn-dependent oxidoreductase
LLISKILRCRLLQYLKKHLTANGIFIPAEPNQENGGESADPQFGFLMVMEGDFEKLTRIANWVSVRKLKVVIDKEFNFSDYLQAFTRLQEKGRRGRIILN